jgi:diguanylate cyclase (GGDEF)-like protein
MPDRAELARRIERAEKLLQKGKTDAALEEYRGVLREDPENDSVRQMAADLSLTLNRVADAAVLMGELFERQVAMGDATRASLTYKKLARYVDPTCNQKIRFGSILENTNKKLALETYDAALQELVLRGSKQEQMAVLKRIVALDPTTTNFVRVGELSSKLGDGKGAAAAFLRVAELAEEAGGAPAALFERAYSEDPTNPKVALAYGKSLVNQGEIGAAIFILEPFISAGTPTMELREAYARALLAANRWIDAEPHIWLLFEQNPSRIHYVANLIGSMVDAQLDADAVALARKLEQYQRRRGERRNFTALMQDITASHRPSPDLLEFLVELFNSSNRENDYCQTLLRLFDLYYKTGNYQKAGECLDRAAEVDSYESGHHQRLEMLKGKIDDNRYKVIASRFTGMSKEKTPEPVRGSKEPALGAATLQDLMLQAEILVQYGMRAKAIERLQHIQELFPQEEEHNQDLQRLYLSAGMTPRYTGGSAPAAPPDSAPGAAAPVFPGITLAPSIASFNESADVSHLTRIAEITRKLYRQANPTALLSTAVQEIGAQWKVSRCIAALRKPGQFPTTAQEYCAEGFRPAQAGSLAKLVAALHDLAIEQGSVTIADALGTAELQPVHEVIAELNATSILALPLTDGQEQTGVFILLQDAPRGWHSSDIVVLKTIGEQLVIAMNNVGLRRLVRTLSVTDEKSGLLSRSSYLDLLQGETRRALQQNVPLTLLLMQFGKSATLVKEVGEPALESTMQQIGRLLVAHIRQNDLAFRYDMTTAAVILGETPEKDGLLAVEKLRRVLEEVHFPGKSPPIAFSAGVAEAVLRPQFDPVDIVTEVINRAEHALEKAAAEGSAQVVALAASFAAAAVA